jgi:UDP-glucuronate decarboxylase
MIPSDIDTIVRSLHSDVAREFAGSRILITGANGFLGRYFQAVFQRLNETRDRRYSENQVVALDNFIASDRSTAGRCIDHDCCLPLHPELPFQFIIHAAGIASPEKYRKFPVETLKVSTDGTEQMLKLAERDGAQLLCFSSSEVCGTPPAEQIPTKETWIGNIETMGPRSCYDVGKMALETYCHTYHVEHSVNVRVVRPFNVVGPGMSRTDYRAFSKFATQKFSGEKLRIYGTGKQTRTFCDVTDALGGFLRALVLGIPGQIYNIGTPSPEITMPELAKLFGCEHELVPYPSSYPENEPMRRCPDISKATNELGYVPGVALEDCVARFLGWAKEAYR